MNRNSGSGFAQIYVVSMYYTDKIVGARRKNKIGVTILPVEEGRGGVAILVLLVLRKGKWRQ